MCVMALKIPEIINKQECIPVGCVPAARWPYTAVCSGGGGMSAPGGVCSRGEGVPGARGAVSSAGSVCSGGCPVRGGVCSGGCAWSGGCLLWGVCLVLGVSAPRGCAWSGGVVYPSMHWGRHPLPLWTEFLTHACENITLASLRCGR